MIIHYVCEIYADFMFANNYEKQISNRESYRPDDNKMLGGYRFFDIEEYEICGEKFKSERKNVSPTHYIGEPISVEEETNKIALSNMRSNGWDYTVRIKCGQTWQTSPGDIIHKSDGTVFVIPEKKEKK